MFMYIIISMIIHIAHAYTHTVKYKIYTVCTTVWVYILYIHVYTIMHDAYHILSWHYCIIIIITTTLAVAINLSCMPYIRWKKCHNYNNNNNYYYRTDNIISK